MSDHPSMIHPGHPGIVGGPSTLPSGEVEAVLRGNTWEDTTADDHETIVVHQNTLRERRHVRAQAEKIAHLLHRLQDTDQHRDLPYQSYEEMAYELISEVEASDLAFAKMTNRSRRMMAADTALGVIEGLWSRVKP